MSTRSLSLAALQDVPPPTLAEVLARARRLVSDRVGIIAEVQFLEMAAEDPPVHQAQSTPANVAVLTGQRAMNRGAATSVDPQRAIIKAVGESVERYCSASYDQNLLPLASYEELNRPAVPPQHFALFSERQYATPGFPYAPLTPQTPVRWVEGYSLLTDRPIYVPAAFVYVPYWYDRSREPVFRDSISTGLACGPTLAAATYKAILEAVERDAFMIVWQNQLARSSIDLESVDDPFAQRLLRTIEGLPVRCHAVVLTLDIPIPVILAILTSESGSPPLTVIGLGTDLDPRRALVLALEEVCLGFCGIRRLADTHADHRLEADYRNVVDLVQHGLVHAVAPELQAAMEFLTASIRTVAIDELPDASSANAVASLRTVVEQLGAQGLDVIAVDLTQPDIDEVGFKVVRAVVPGLQPLDINHKYQHLGGRRLYEVPWQLGLISKPRSERDLNPYPHPFP